MSSSEIFDISREALLVLLKIAGPLLIVSLVVGLLISFVQALTQIQETTLVFVPKIVCLFLALLFLLPYMGETLKLFTERIFDRIIGLS